MFKRTTTMSCQTNSSRCVRVKSVRSLKRWTVFLVRFCSNGPLLQHGCCIDSPFIQILAVKIAAFCIWKTIVNVSVKRRVILLKGLFELIFFSNQEQFWQLKQTYFVEWYVEFVGRQVAAFAVQLRARLLCNLCQRHLTAEHIGRTSREKHQTDQPQSAEYRFWAQHRTMTENSVNNVHTDLHFLQINRDNSASDQSKAHGSQTACVPMVKNGGRQRVSHT